MVETEVFVGENGDKDSDSITRNTPFDIVSGLVSLAQIKSNDE
jgi:hypothetical protein